MKLLICTQTLDRKDPVLGFFHAWVRAFAEQAESVIVVALSVGEYELPKNVRVFSLGKESGAGRIRRTLRFFKIIFEHWDAYDRVFVHMNPEYLTLAGLFWRLGSKRTLLWYAHRQVNLKLRLAVLLTRSVASPAPESFQLSTDKLSVVGHGIETARFKNPHPIGELARPLRIVSVGRITPIKNLDVLIEAVKLLKERGVESRLTLVGAPAVPSDRSYEISLKKQVRKLGLEDAVVFRGAVGYDEIPAVYHSHDISINLCPTGGIDKAVLESMAAGLLVFASNTGFTPYFGSHADKLLFSERNASDLVYKLTARFEAGDSALIRKDLAENARAADTNEVVRKLAALLI